MLSIKGIMDVIEESMEGMDESTNCTDNPYDTMGELYTIFGMVDYF